MIRTFSAWQEITTTFHDDEVTPQHRWILYDTGEQRYQDFDLAGQLVLERITFTDGIG